MPRPGVFGQPDQSAQKAAGLAILRRDEEAIRTLRTLRITQSPVPMRLAMAALAGVLLLMAQTGFLWAWLGAAFFMLALAGAPSRVAAAGGAMTGAMACFRLLASSDASGIFLVLVLFHATAGAIAGALAAEISRKLPPAAFAFVAALLPAGLEQLGSFGGGGNLLSTALTQYAHPVVLKVARLGGLAGVTYVIFVFGGAAASAVRYARETEILLKSTLPPLGLVVLALLYGAASSSAAPATVLASAFVPSSRMAELDALTSRPAYNEEAWTAYLGRLAEDMHRASQKHMTAKAIDRTQEEQAVGLMVWPEAAVVLNDATRETFLKRLAGIASGTGCVQVAAYYDWDRMESSAVIAAGRGDIGAPYSRRRFVPRVDDVFVPDQIATPGLSAPSPTPTGIGSVGTLLSFDANFFENFKSIAKGGGQIACVCGYDDEKVPEISLRLLVYNAATSGLAVVRSARNGLLAAISPDGEIVARAQTSQTADATLLARLPLGEADAPFLSVGNAFGWLALLAGLACGLYAATLREPVTPDARRDEPAGSGPISYKTREGIKRL